MVGIPYQLPNAMILFIYQMKQKVEELPAKFDVGLEMFGLNTPELRDIY